jgi:GNAT superfamily N-acetyltransferase
MIGLATMMPRHSIRPAGEEDCAEIVRLSSQLGYPATTVAMQKRLQRLLASSANAIFVAESANGGLAGWIHGVLSQVLEADYRVEIAGLIVDERFQRMGVGRALVERVEDWAKSQGIELVVVRCRSTRIEAHQFYASLGYNQTKTQIVFRKSFEPRANPT